MDNDPKLLEKDAHTFFSHEKFDEAFKLFKSAADIYASQGNHSQASLCLASAASCWSIKCGEKTFYSSAQMYEKAAKEAVLSGDFKYASLLCKYAAICYERDMEFINFSECFYLSKEYYRKYLFSSLIISKKGYHMPSAKQQEGAIKRFLLWLAMTISFLVWGHGERPVRTFYFGFLLILVAAFVHTYGRFISNGTIFTPNFFEAFYFSVVTFSTVGYGDIVPIGYSRFLVMIEMLCGMFVVPIFVVGLARKYFRV